jgi:hypothetical protein
VSRRSMQVTTQGDQHNLNLASLSRIDEVVRHLTLLPIYDTPGAPMLSCRSQGVLDRRNDNLAYWRNNRRVINAVDSRAIRALPPEYSE